MRKPLVLLGTGSSLKHAPIRDPNVELWGLPVHATAGVPLALAFEVHDETLMRDVDAWTDLATVPCPVYTWPTHRAAPNARAYPLDEVTRRFTPPGRVHAYLTSSICYMLAFLLLQDEPPPSVSIFGVDVKQDGEHEDQRAANEWWLGIVFGRGIPFTLPAESDLLKVRFRYGVDERQRDLALADLYDQLAQLQRHLDDADQVQQQAFGRRQQLRGQVAVLERELRAATLGSGRPNLPRR